MTWVERLRKNISFTSPGGDQFIAKWIGDERRKEKKLGIFNYPLVQGTVVQDLDISSSRYPLTFFFDGEDNDLEAQAFYDATNQRGKWEVLHPVYGNRELQLVSITEVSQPVISGNITQFNSEWIESVDIETIESTTEEAGIIENENEQLKNQNTDDFKSNAKTDTAKQKTGIQSVSKMTVSKVISTMSAIYSKNADIQNRIENIIRSMDEVLATEPLDIRVLGGQIQQIIQLPIFTTPNVLERLSALSILTNEVIAIETPGKTKNDIPAIATKEITLGAIIGAACLSASTGTLQTRRQAIDAVNSIMNIVDLIFNSLDIIQNRFNSNAIDIQYAFFLNSFNIITSIVARSINYLLTASLDLAIEKTIVLKKPRCPIEITITEYGDLGDNDSNFDLFIDSNNLKGKEIRLLPAGRKVVVYV